jgi:aromatic-L-amino-acid decarboxylase
MTSRYPLEPTGDEMSSMASEAFAYLKRFISNLDDAPAMNVDNVAEAARTLRERVPEEGTDFSPLLEVVEAAAAKGFETAGPGYLAFIPGGGLYVAAVANLLASGLNRFTQVSATAPALAQLEWNVIEWFAGIFDYPSSTKGILTSGGSLANFSAIVSARRDRLPEDFLSGTLYVSDQGHLSVDKAAILAGFPLANVRHVPTTRDLRMDVDALRSMTNEDRRRGLQPFLVIGSAGTTNTGAIDPLTALHEFAAQEGLWFHVDAAYGGFFQLTQRGRKRFEGIERADSITLDPHKGMFLPYGTGCLLVREGELLKRAHDAGHAGYLQDLEGIEAGDFADYSPELSRNYRGLPVWLALKLHGLSAFRDALNEKLDLAEFAYRELSEVEGFELPWQPELSIVPFRYRFGDGDDNDRNRLLLRRINDSRRVFISSTEVRKEVFLRAAILSHRTHLDRMKEAVEIFKSEGNLLGLIQRG